MNSWNIPQQTRSQATLERIASTARKALLDQQWEELKVDELCRNARSSVGAFYARFADKSSLLAYLADEAEQEYAAVVAWFCRDVDQRELPLASSLRQLVAALWRYTDRHAGVLRALIELRRPLPFDDPLLAEHIADALGNGERSNTATRLLLDVLRARLIKNTGPGRPDMELARVLSTWLR